jgi:hypothetical protein
MSVDAKEKRQALSQRPLRLSTLFFPFFSDLEQEETEGREL